MKIMTETSKGQYDEEKIRELFRAVLPTREELVKLTCADEVVDFVKSETDRYVNSILCLINQDDCTDVSNNSSESQLNSDDFSSDIPSLKKRIKYCRNPLERKSLERQLNTAYKRMKKRR